MARREVTGRRPGVTAAKANRTIRDNPDKSNDLAPPTSGPAASTLPVFEDREPRPLPVPSASSARSKVRARGPPGDGEASASTIPQFCAKHAISESFYYKLRAQNLAPRELRLGARVLITNEAAADWRRAQEARTAADWRREHETRAAEVAVKA
jgi:hypothetical protein